VNIVYRKSFLSLLLLVFTGLSVAATQEQELDDLLKRIQQQGAVENKINKQREEEFLNAKNRQQQLLAEAKATLRVQEQQRDRLKATFHEQEKRLTQLENTLQERLGVLGELFGVARQVAGDTLGEFENSIITAQHPGRLDFVKRISKSKFLPAISDLEKLWFLLQQEIIESGKVVSYQGKIVTKAGSDLDTTVTRIGAFNAVTQSGYLRYIPETIQLAELAKQPDSTYLGTVDDIMESKGELTGVGIDPTRGSMLSLLVQLPNIWDRIQQGKLIGYIIILLAITGLVIAVMRLVSLSATLKKIVQQKQNSNITSDNPLGRVLAVFEQNRQVDTDTLEKRIDEAVLTEIPHLERAVSTIKILAAIAPLLGLLGTVTGMIGTFQSITLFGTGDPRLMSSGISQALVTTVLGLTAAIPLIFLHSLVLSKSKACIAILEEQGAGIVAQHAEGRKAS